MVLISKTDRKNKGEKIEHMFIQVKALSLFIKCFCEKESIGLAGIAQRLSVDL